MLQILTSSRSRLAEKGKERGSRTEEPPKAVHTGQNVKDVQPFRQFKIFRHVGLLFKIQLGGKGY